MNTIRPTAGPAHAADSLAATPLWRRCMAILRKALTWRRHSPPTRAVPRVSMPIVRKVAATSIAGAFEMPVRATARRPGVQRRWKAADRIAA